MVGTIFINYLASSLSTVCQHAQLEIKNPKYQVKHELGLVNGAARNLLVELPHDFLQRTELILTVPATGDRIVRSGVDAAGDPAPIVDQVYRYKFIELIQGNLFKVPEAAAKVQALFNEIKGLPAPSDFLNRLAIDLVDPHPNHGQVEKAFQPSFFAKWGKDYLRSLALFHAVEQSGNFKDESLQLYGGPKFAEYRAFASKVFMALPAPKARESRMARASGFSGSSPSPIRAVAMHRFYDHGGVCFSGDAFVELRIGEKRVRDLVKGDVLFDGGVVECLVETVEWGAQCDAVVLNGVAFTPYHPIEINGTWVFPADVADVVAIHIDSWFNLVLTGNKVARLNGVKTVTLGHNMTKGCLTHPFFGTEAVIRQLKGFQGYAEGHVRRPHPVAVARDANGMIIDTF
jgi:hypothetical protein